MKANKAGVALLLWHPWIKNLVTQRAPCNYCAASRARGDFPRRILQAAHGHCWGSRSWLGAAVFCQGIGEASCPLPSLLALGHRQPPVLVHPSLRANTASAWCSCSAPAVAASSSSENTGELQSLCFTYLVCLIFNEVCLNFVTDTIDFAMVLTPKDILC